MDKYLGPSRVTRGASAASSAPLLLRWTVISLELVTNAILRRRRLFALRCKVHYHRRRQIDRVSHFTLFDAAAATLNFTNLFRDADVSFRSHTGLTIRSGTVLFVDFV